MDLLIKGKLPIKDLCARCLARAKKYKHLNFLVAQVADETIDDMHQERDVGLADQQKQLRGIPIAVKSNFSTIGMETSCASRMLQNYVPTYNATVVQKLLDQDAVLIGKTNLDEFAMGSGTVDSIHGPVYNPWSYMLDGGLPRDKQDWLVAGGSSGGSAVAVATGSSLIALASDTGGSTRNPASYCGVVGLKATYGLLSRHGLIPLVNSMDVPGILTCSIDAAAATLNILAGHDIMDSTTLTDSFKEVILDETPNVKGLHIGIPKEYFAPGLSSEVASWWDRVAGMLDNAGATVSQVSLPHTQYSIVCYHILGNCEVASNMARYDGIEFGHRATGAEQSTEQLFAMSRHEGFNDVVRGRILAGNYFLLKRNYDAYFLKAQKVRRLISEDFSKVFDGGIDLLLTPTTLTDAPTYRSFSSQDNRTQSAKQDVLTQSVNLAGLPAVSVPVGLSSRHLPIGLQLIGQFQGEQTMLSVAKWIEAQVDFPYFEWEKYT